MDVVQVSELCKKYKNRYRTKIALDNISFSVKKGEILGIIGPSGVGKTTLLKILTGQLLPDSGQFDILGEKISQKTYENLGIMMSDGLYETLSIKYNLQLFAEIFNINSKRVDQLLKITDLYELRNKKVAKLSSGEKQRLLLCRTLLHQPQLLLLDEPTSRLDPKNTVAIHELLSKLKREGKTIILTTHDMLEAEQICDRVIFLHQGRVIEIGRPYELKLKYDPKVKYELMLKNGEFLKFTETRGDLLQISALLENKKVATLHTCEPTLNDIFLKLVKGGKDK